LFAVGLAVAVLGFTMWRFVRQPDRPDVLLITLDTTRADRLGCYGSSLALTPTLDTLAAHGTLFERGYTPAPLTLPAHASLMTALHPPEHGLVTNGRGRLPPDITTLAEVLREGGYETGAFIGSFVLHQKFGLHRGFQVYDDDLSNTVPTPNGMHRQRDGSDVVTAALKWLRLERRKPFFCWVHLYDAHAPYLAREEEFGPRFQDQPYDAGIAYADRQIQRLIGHLQSSGKQDRTLTVIVGDHGEGLLQHAEQEHGLTLYENVMRIPWIWSGPDIAKARRISECVSLVDFRPTLLDYLGIRDPASHSGRSLKPALTGGEINPRECYLGTDFPLLEHGWSPQRALVSGHWKYIRSPETELYDLHADPGEQHNLATQLPDRIQELEYRLSEIEAAFSVHQGADVYLTPQEQRSLTSLGYLSGQTSTDQRPNSDRALLDVKAMLPGYNRVREAGRSLNAGRLAEAEMLLRQVSHESPNDLSARLLLADALRQQKKYDDSRLMSESVLDLDSENSEAHFQLGNVHMDLGEHAAAAEEFRVFLAQRPAVVEVLMNLGLCQEKLGLHDEAESTFNELLDHDPLFVKGHIALASLLFRQQRLDEAENHYREAIHYAPNAAEAHGNLALILAGQQRMDEAEPHFARAVQFAPQNAELQFHYGLFLLSQGRLDDAVQTFEVTLRLDPQHAQAKARLQQALQGRRRS